MEVHFLTLSFSGAHTRTHTHTGELNLIDVQFSYLEGTAICYGNLLTPHLVFLYTATIVILSGKEVVGLVTKENNS